MTVKAGLSQGEYDEPHKYVRGVQVQYKGLDQFESFASLSLVDSSSYFQPISTTCQPDAFTKLKILLNRFDY